MIEKYTHAIARQPGENFAQGLSTSNLGHPQFELMLAQHQAYVAALRSLGLSVTVLDPLLEYPDAYYVEDCAVIAPEVVVITRPGAVSRRGEEQALEPILAEFRQIERIDAPGTVDGGDVLVAGKQVWIGLSERTNQTGAEQLGGILERNGYQWQTLRVGSGLHLKSSINWLGGNRLIVTPEWAAYPALGGYDLIVVDEDESYAANTLWVNDHLLIPGGFPKVRERLSVFTLPLIELQVSEARKMDGGLTCMSLRL